MFLYNWLSTFVSTHQFWSVFVVIVFSLLYASVLKDRREYRRAQAEALAETRVLRQRMDTENNKRGLARRAWLAGNKVELYYNTLYGVTAVLRPHDYLQMKKLTVRSRRDGYWQSEEVLHPAKETVVFVTKQGADLITTNLGTEQALKYWSAGRISQLDDICRQGSVELVKKEDIFVPWVNESLVSFEQQRHTIEECTGKDNFFTLVELQAPIQTHPIDLAGLL